MKNLFIMLLIACMCSGCATALTLYTGRHNERYSLSEGVYQATKLDVTALSYLPHAWQEDNKFEVITEVPFIVIDLPFSLTFDTLLLPFDLLPLR